MYFGHGYTYPLLVAMQEHDVDFRFDAQAQEREGDDEGDDERDGPRDVVAHTEERAVGEGLPERERDRAGDDRAKQVKERREEAPRSPEVGDEQDDADDDEVENHGTVLRIGL